MQKKVMIIGAGTHQAKGIETAKRMGLFVIATDGNPAAPGLALADRSFVLDVKDREANLRIAREQAVDGVTSIASEVSIETVAYIAQTLGLPGLDVAVAERCTDKALMREAFFDHGVPSPRSYAVYRYEELLERIGTLGYPVVIKPADNAGSRGVSKVDQASEIRPAYEDALNNSRKHKIVVEEFMDGVEVSVEAFVVNEEIHIIGLSDKVRTPPPYLLDIKVIFPSTYSEAIQQKIVDVAVRAIKAVGIKTGPIHMELMMTKNGPVPVELAARGPGFKVFTDILPMITGIDLIKASIQLSLGDQPDLTRTRNLSATIKFIDVASGIVRTISGMERAKNIRGIHELELYVKAGDRVRSLTCGADRVGHVIAVADTRAASESAAEEAATLLALEIDALPA